LQTFPDTHERILLMTGNISVVLTALHLLLAKAKENGAVALSSQPPGRRPVDTSSPGHTIVRLVVPDVVCGAILGKGGETLKSFIEDSGASIVVSSKDALTAGLTDRAATISGSLDQVMRATALVATKMVTDSGYPLLTRPLPVFGAHGGYSPGGGGSGSGGAYFTRGGGGRHAPEHHSTVAAGDTTSIELQVPEHQVGGIIGRGGATIREIESVTGTRVQVAPREDAEMADADAMDGGADAVKMRTVRITGTPDMVEAAQIIVRAKMLLPSPGRGRD
jgi:RNA-binding protein Nova